MGGFVRKKVVERSSEIRTPQSHATSEVLIRNTSKNAYEAKFLVLLHQTHGFKSIRRYSRVLQRQTWFLKVANGSKNHELTYFLVEIWRFLSEGSFWTHPYLVKFVLRAFFMAVNDQARTQTQLTVSKPLHSLQFTRTKSTLSLALHNTFFKVNSEPEVPFVLMIIAKVLVFFHLWSFMMISTTCIVFRSYWEEIGSVENSTELSLVE